MGRPPAWTWTSGPPATSRRRPRHRRDAAVGPGRRTARAAAPRGTVAGPARPGRAPVLPDGEVGPGRSVSGFAAAELGRMVGCPAREGGRRVPGEAPHVI